MRYYLILCCASIIYTESFAQPESDFVTLWKKEFTDAQNAKSAGVAWKKLVELHHGDVTTLVSDKNASLSLAAAWKHAHARNDRKGLHGWNWFLGFMQAKTRVDLPLEWESHAAKTFYSKNRQLCQAALDSYAKRTGAVTASDFGYDWKPTRHTRSDLGLWVSDGLEIRKDGDKILIKTGKAQECRLPSKVFDNIRERFPKLDQINAAVYNERCIIALYDKFGGKFPLICVNTMVGEVDWEKYVWAMGSELLLGVTTGVWWHEVRLVLSAESVVLFGASVQSYFEQFRLIDGQEILKFSSNAWYSISEE